MDNYHVTKKADQWRFARQGSPSVIATADTKAEVMSEMRGYMSSHVGSVKIHKENGVLQEERTYPRSADPRGSKG